jgi:hypothetical protein
MAKVMATARQKTWAKEMHLLGVPRQQIAKTLGVSGQTAGRWVSDDLAASLPQPVRIGSKLWLARRNAEARTGPGPEH